jgi:hypothetical protein
VWLPSSANKTRTRAGWLSEELAATRAHCSQPAARFAPSTHGEHEIGQIDLARDDAARLECLRIEAVRPEDDVLHTSILQFDVLSNVAAIDAAQSTDTRAFYANFARFYQWRIQPIVERLLTDSAMPDAIVRGTDAELAAGVKAADP